MRLETAVTTGDDAGVKRWSAQARKSARTAQGSAAKVAWRRAEVLRLAARYRWLTGKRRRARRLFERSLDWAEKLGARPELARTWATVGRVLASDGGTLRGLDGAAYLARARATFEDLGLQTDLARLTAS